MTTRYVGQSLDRQDSLELSWRESGRDRAYVGIRQEEHHMASTPTSDPQPLRRLLSITEIADALGVEVRHVRRLVHERRIPFIKWGHLLRFDPEEIRSWIDHHRQHPGRPRLDA